MANQAGRNTEAVHDGDDVLLALLCVLRDDLHRLAVEVAEGIATVERYQDVSVLLREASLRLHREGRRLGVHRNGRAEL